MLNIHKLEFRYGNHLVLNNICVEIPLGCCLAILGNNGAGKSTLLKCMNKILHPFGGQIELDGQNIFSLSRNAIAKKIAYVAQSAETSRFTVFDTVLLGRKPYIRFSPSKEDYAIVEDIICRMGLSSMSMSFTDELSGGELQKVMLARALAQHPKILLLDEPTSNLDLKNQYEVLHIIRDITISQGISAVIIIHDLNLALRYCDRFLLLRDNKIYAYGGAEVMNAENISAVYDIPVTLETLAGTKLVIPLTENVAVPS